MDQGVVNMLTIKIHFFPHTVMLNSYQKDFSLLLLNMSCDRSTLLLWRYCLNTSQQIYLYLHHGAIAGSRKEAWVRWTEGVGFTVLIFPSFLFYSVFSSSSFLRFSSGITGAGKDSMSFRLLCCAVLCCGLVGL